MYSGGHMKINDVVKWKNLFGIWQHAKVEVMDERFPDYVGVRRFPPEDSEGLPNDKIINLHVSIVEVVENY